MVRIRDFLSASGLDKAEYIRQLYDALVQREPSQAELVSSAKQEHIESAFSELLSSDELRQKARSSHYLPGLKLTAPERLRILLFGAYGNGNLGDKVQAQSLARAIRSIRPQVEVWASSALPAAYPFCFDFVLPGKMLKDPRVINEFDMLIIGGGGLLSHPHDPLTDERWQEAIHIPIALFGIGVSPDVASKSEILLRKAVYVSGRDDHSISSLQRFCKSINYVPDPVLCDEHFIVSEFTNDVLVQQPTKKLWILKAFAEGLPQWIDLVDLDRDEVCFLEPHLDFPLIAKIPGAKPIYRASDLVRMIDRADMVLSMRYHGCIFAMLRDRPAVGIREQKSFELLRRFGNGKYFVIEAPTSIDSIKELTRTQQYIRPTALAQERQTFMEELHKLIAMIEPQRRLKESAPPPVIRRESRAVSAGSLIRRQDITVCMIVYNEEEFLSYSLKSLVQYFDRFLILDMGSQDATVTIVRDLAGQKAKIIAFERDLLLDHGYAYARNYVAGFAVSPWILAVDADEILVSGIMEDGIPINRPPEQVSVVTVERRNLEGRPGGLIKDLQLDREQLRSTERHRRLYRPCGNVAWAGYLHETLYARERASTAQRESASDLVFYHAARFRNQDRSRYKQNQYFWMLLRAYNDRELRDGTSSYWYDKFVPENLQVVQAGAKAFLESSIL
jgi:polysaccharide pyruvyl transferase WcaK-like protein